MIIDIHAFSYWLLIGFLYSELFAKVLNFIEKHPCWLIFLSFRGAYDRGYERAIPQIFTLGGLLYDVCDNEFLGELFIDLC